MYVSYDFKTSVNYKFCFWVLLMKRMHKAYETLSHFLFLFRSLGCNMVRVKCVKKEIFKTFFYERVKNFSKKKIAIRFTTYVHYFSIPIFIFTYNPLWVNTFCITLSRLYLSNTHIGIDLFTVEFKPM